MTFGSRRELKGEREREAGREGEQKEREGEREIIVGISLHIVFGLAWVIDNLRNLHFSNN